MNRLATGFLLCSVILVSVIGSTGPVLAVFPYETSSESELTVLGSSAVLFGLSLWVEADDASNRAFIPEEIAILDASLVNNLDRGATENWSPGAARLSDIFMYSSMVAPVSMSMTSVGSLQPLTLTTMHLETLLLNGGVTYLLKNLFRRTRPFVYNTDAAIPMSLKMSHTARRSFPSGHTSTAFASMVFMATVYGQMYPESETKNWVWAGCLATAGVTGYLRYAAGYHYPTDILAGAALGAFTGWLVPQLHEIDRDTPSGTPAKANMVLGLTIGF